jgi:hypothetical protein
MFPELIQALGVFFDLYNDPDYLNSKINIVLEKLIKILKSES